MSGPPDPSNNPLPRTAAKTVEVFSSFNTPIWQNIGSVARWVILALLAWAMWSIPRWMDEAIAKSPSVALVKTATLEANAAALDAKNTAVMARAAVIEANTVAADAKTAAAAAVVKSDAITISQEKISGYLQRNIEEQKATRDLFAAFDKHLAVVEVKVEEGAKLTAAEIAGLKERLNTLQK